MQTCNPKFFGVLSFVLATVAFGSEKTSLCPRARCNSRYQKEIAPPLERVYKEVHLKTPKKTVVVFSLTNIIF
ncbi:hypothetical protein TNCV_136481 [Trichonephila clavipes]|nr:hypothetical protein TNCV_136481 [Trichonephila clavipes]